ncbi:MAG: DEAD/DEAH box helicase family protein [Bacilli bacterium]
MSFLEYEIPNFIRTGLNPSAKDFFLLLLKETKIYKRAVGFFSSSILIELEEGINKLVNRGGKIQLIMSPILSKQDIEAIELGEKSKEEVIETSLLDSIELGMTTDEFKRFNYMLNLIINNILEIKIAILKNEPGIYHEKIGILEDFEGNKVVIKGSANESGTALKDNFEACEVFKNWKEADNERVDRIANDFNDLWNNNNEALDIIDIPDAIKKEMLKMHDENLAMQYKNELIAIDNRKKLEKENDYENYNPHFPLNKPYNEYFRDYQKEAIDNWFKFDNVGIFNMATGTGKTLTAIAAATKFFEKYDKLALIIVCPYIHLIEQWTEDLEEFNFKPITAYSSSKMKDWKKRFEQNIDFYNADIPNMKVMCLITTNATYTSEYIQKQINRINKNVVLIVDEAHNFGAENLAKKLNINIKYRLALSATFERYNDSEGTSNLYKYFQNMCINYDLQQAIDSGKLTPYYYKPIIVYLTEDELIKYNNISKQISKNIIIVDGKKKLNDYGKILCLNRARIVAGAYNKVGKLIELLKEETNLSNILIYCGATTVNDSEFDEVKDDKDEVKQIESVILNVRNEFKNKIKISPFTSKETMDERKNIIDTFVLGELNAIAAIKCLDEGVNIPAIDKAYILASSTNPREYIQRKGRVLRTYKEKKYATIYDFITLPRCLETAYMETEETLKCDVGLVKRELDRIEDFTKTCLNKTVSFEITEKIEEVYGNLLEGKGEEYE